MSLDPLLLNLLACPIDKQALLYLAEDDVLYNPRLRRLYRVRDGIPVMLADQGETVSEDQHRDLLRRAAAGGALTTLQVALQRRAGQPASRRRRGGQRLRRGRSLRTARHRGRSPG